jgi:lipid A 4'-phosphatase
LRMAGGAHFFSDVIFAGVLMFVLVWTLHGLIYRWRATRLTDEAVEGPLERIGKGMREWWGTLRRGAGGKSQRS